MRARRSLPVLAACALVVALAAPAAAETFEWDTVDAPPEFDVPRFFAAGAANPAGTQAVVYGGKPDGPPGPGVPYADTWVYEGGDWEPRCGTSVSGADSPCGPGNTFFHGAGTGPAGVVMFGAGETAGERGTTWNWDGSSWSVLCDQTGCPPGDGDAVPVGRLTMAMAGNGAQVLMYGGLIGGPGGASDTWSFDGANWTEICSACAPGGLISTQMGWDGEKFVMFGGQSGPGQPTNANTWTFTPGDSDWVQACGPADCGPSPRALQAMGAVTGANPGVLMLGGNADPGGSGDSLERDFWFWEQATDSWSPVAAGPWESDGQACGFPVFIAGGLQNGAVAGIGFGGLGFVGAPDLAQSTESFCPAGGDPGGGDPGGGDPGGGDPGGGDPGGSAPGGTDPGGGTPGADGPSGSGPDGSGGASGGTPTLPATGPSDILIAAASALMALTLGLALVAGSRRRVVPAVRLERESNRAR